MPEPTPSMFPDQFKSKAPNLYFQVGSGLCCDLHCECGVSSHIDRDYVTLARCPSCGATYELKRFIDVIKATPEVIKAYPQAVIVTGDAQGPPRLSRPEPNDN